MQERVHLLTSALIPGHTNYVVISRCVALFPGCESPCNQSKTVHRHCSGTRGRCDLMEMSRRIVLLELLTGTAFTASGAEGDDCRAWI